MQNLTLLPLEPYRQRYTENLHKWESEAFRQANFEVTSLVPKNVAALDISSGQVLDSILRPTWALAQTLSLLENPSPDLGKIYSSDFYFPGLDALAYSRKKFQMFSFLWAQTFDRFDFTVQFMDWMRPWEIMGLELNSQVFVASTLLADLITTAVPNSLPKIQIVGLPFNSKHILSVWNKAATPAEDYDCVYSSRWDTEKNPNFFLSLVESMPNLRFAICTGWPSVRGTDTVAINRLSAMQARGQGNLTVFTGLDKGTYYAILSKSAVQFNCASQDWVSFTLLEALAMGCVPLYPNMRSFPEALYHERDSLYRPLDLHDAQDHLSFLLRGSRKFPLKDDILRYHDGTLGRIAEIIYAH